VCCRAVGDNTSDHEGFAVALAGSLDTYGGRDGIDVLRVGSSHATVA
jgi:hypothetical protein